MPRAAVLVASAVAATAVIVGGGVLALGTSDTTAPTAPTDGAGPAPFRTTPLADYDTAGAVVSRGPFCDAVGLPSASKVPRTRCTSVNSPRSSIACCCEAVTSSS